MPTETQELQLKVTLIDNVTPNLARVRGQMQEVGQKTQQHAQQMSGGHENMEKMRRNIEEVGKAIRGALHGNIEQSSASLSRLAGGAGLAITAVAGIGVAFYEVGKKLREFSQKMIELRTLSQQTGFGAGEIKSVVDQMAQMGVGGREAITNIQGIARAIADVSTQGSELRRKLMGMTTNKEGMERFLQNLIGFGNKGDLVGAINSIVEAATNVYDNALKEHGPVVAAAWRSQFLANLGLNAEMLALYEKLRTASASERAKIEADIKQSQEYAKAWEQVSQKVDQIWRGVQRELMPLMKEFVGASDDVAETWGVSIGGAIREVVETVKPIIKFLTSSPEDASNQIWEALKGRLTAMPEQWKKNQEEALRKMQERQAEEQRLKNMSRGEYWEEMKSWFGLGKKGGAAATPQKFANLGTENQRGLIEDEQDLMKQVIVQFTRLNALLSGEEKPGAAGGPVSGGGALGLMSTQMGGLGPGMGAGGGMGRLPGFSGGGGGYTGGGGGYTGGGGGGGYRGGGGGPYGSDVGAGTGAGAGATPAQPTIGTPFGPQAGGGFTPGPAGPPGPGAESTGKYPVSASEKERGGALYQKLLAEFRANPPKGVPPDGARFGITKGTPEEWARFGVSVAKAESSFNPATKNLSDPGGSFGVFQYAHGQVPGGNAYDVDASVKAFVRDAGGAAVHPGGIGGGRRGDSILSRRFSTIGRNPGASRQYLGMAGTIASSVSGATATADSKVAMVKPRIEQREDLANYLAPERTNLTAMATTPGGAQPIRDISQAMNLNVGGKMTPEGLMIHHTSGREKGAEGVASVLRNRNLSVQYVIDRDGNITQISPEGRTAYHAGNLEKSMGKTGRQFGNTNLEGVEVIAKNEGDVTDAQRAAIANLTAQRSKRWGWDPKTSVWGHGELTGRKESDEGSTARMIREGKMPLPDLSTKSPIQTAQVRATDLDRDTLDTALTSRDSIVTKGKLVANVEAPKGTQVSVKGEGAFKKTETNRTITPEKKEAPTKVAEAASAGGEE
jgi:hypothetical protein